MAVESEVSVVSIEDKSCQDLVKDDSSLVSHGDQSNGCSDDDSRVFVVNALGDDDNVEKLGGVEDSAVETKPVCNGSSGLLSDGSVEETENGNAEERGYEFEAPFVNGSRDENVENGVGVQDSRGESVPFVEFRDGDSDALAVEERENGNTEERGECEVPFVNGSRDGSDENVENWVGVEDSHDESVPFVEFRDGDSDVLDVEERENGNVEKQNGEIESVAECEVPLVEVANGKLESLAGVEIEMNDDNKGNIEGVAEAEQEKVEEFIVENGDPDAVELPGARVEEVVLVGDSIEKEELKDLSSRSESDIVDDEREDQNNEVSMDTSELYNGASHLVSCAVGNELEEENTEVQDEAPLVTAMDSDMGLHPITNEKILTEKEELNNFSSHERADNVGGENQITDETLSMNTGSADAVESGLQEACTGMQIKAELEGEVIECSELETPVPISVDAGPEFFPIEEKMLKENGELKRNLTPCNSESNDAEVTLVKSVDSDETFEAEEAKTTVAFDNEPNDAEVTLVKSVDSNETFETEEAKTTVAFDVIEKQKQVVEVSCLVSSTDRHVETVAELVSDEKDTVCISVSNIDGTVQYHEDTEKSLGASEASHVPMQFESADSLPTQSLSISHVNNPDNEINMSDAETVEAISFPPTNAKKTEPVEKHTSIEPDSKLDTIAYSGEEPFTSVNTKLDHGKSRSSLSVTYKKDLLESFNINREAASNITWGSAKIKFGTANVEDIEDKSDGNPVVSHGNLMLKENEHTEICKIDAVLVASSGTDEMCKEELSIKPVTTPFHFMVRVPRFDDESLKERIKLQEIQLDDWTQQRDAIRVLIQEKRKAIDQSHGVKYENARNHVNSSWKLVRSKRGEMDSLQPAINKVKSAASIQDIDQRICSMEYKIQHESMPLKEEKQLIHEIKQQKQLRKHLSSNIGSDDEIKESREQLETLEERMKSLKKEHEILKGNAEKAEAPFVEAKRKYDVEYKKVDELQARYRVANDSRQEAYNQLKSLRKELKEKNKHFYKFKDDATAAYNCARSKDRDALHSQCKNQVEKFMELWNNNDKFRKEYVTFNAKSTVRRFGTLDGRALGANEEGPVIQDYVPSYVDQKVHKLVSTPAKIYSASKISVLELKEEIKLENGILEEKTNKTLIKSKGKASVEDKEAAKPGLTTVSSKNVSQEVQVEVLPTKSKEEIELERIAEELRRRENEAKLKEQLRLEEIVKAQEARERKKRKEEKEKRRAELRAQKEAEQKEKEREKRLRKKEKKNTSTTVTAESSNSIDPASLPENILDTAQEIEAPKEASATSKKLQRPVFTKRNKPRVIQSPPQIRRKRNWVRNPWVIMAVIIAATSIIIFYNMYMKREVATLGI